MNSEKVFCLSTESLNEAGYLTAPYKSFDDPENDLNKLLDLEFQFMPRNVAENNCLWKQLIPYQVFIYNNTLFTFQRGSGINEQRLVGRLSVGIGGHINLTDFDKSSSLKDMIFNSAARERNEELKIEGTVHAKLIGLINDDSDSVGRVHIGIVMAYIICDPNKICLRRSSEDLIFY